MAGHDQSSGWVGTVLQGRWRIEAQVGRGGVATVFRARNVSTATVGAQAAIKLMHPQFARSADARARFLREG